MSIIIGRCDLLRERTDAAEIPDAEIVAGIEIVRRVAFGVVRELKQHGCDLDPVRQSVMLCDAVEEVMGKKRPEAVPDGIRTTTVQSSGG